MKFAFRILIHHKLSCIFSYLNYGNVWRVRRQIANLTNGVRIQRKCKLVFLAFNKICLEFAFFCFSIWTKNVPLSKTNSLIWTNVLKNIYYNFFNCIVMKNLFFAIRMIGKNKTLDSAIKAKSIWHSAMYLFSMRCCTPDASLFIDLFFQILI